MAFRGDVKGTEVVSYVLVGSHEQGHRLRNPDIVLASQSAWEDPHQLILCNFLSPQIDDKSRNRVLRSLDVDIVSPLNVARKNKKLAVELFNFFLDIG